MTAFNLALYLSLSVPLQRDCLSLLRRGCSSHRHSGNLVVSDSLYTPDIVRFFYIDLTITDLFLLSDACTVERGLSSGSNPVSSPPTPPSQRAGCKIRIYSSYIIQKTNDSMKYFHHCIPYYSRRYHLRFRWAQSAYATK